MDLKRTKAVVLPACNENLIRGLISMQVQEIEIPPLKEDEVLVKMIASPVNPSDIALLRGMYNFRKPEPFIPGFEGCGMVVQVGSDQHQQLNGKRVSCYTKLPGTGTWSEFFVARVNDCIIVRDEVPAEQAACMAINPYTALGIMELIMKQGCRAVIQNAAGGQVGRMIRLLCKEKGTRVINIVRKTEHIKLLHSEGEEFALCTADPDFYTVLSKLAIQLDARIALDAAGGEMTGMLMNSMPPGSSCILYGGLSGNPVSGINSLDVIFRGKQLRGFNLNEYIASLDRNQFDKNSEFIQQMIITGKLKVNIAGSFPLEDVVKGIRTYIKNMSGGKVLLVGRN